MRVSVTLTALALAIAAAGLYQLKYEVAALEATRDSMARALGEERQAIHVLSAEWAYLNQPQRLAELARRHLDLAPLDAARIVTFADLAGHETELAAAGDEAPQ